MGIRALLSRSDGSDEAVELAAWQERPLKQDELLWIDAQAPSGDERDVITGVLSLDAATLEAVDSDDDLPDARVLDDGVVVTVQTIDRDIDEEPALLRIVVGPEWALTWHSEAIEFLDEHLERIQDRREVGRLTPLLFLVAMLGWHLDTFFDAADQLERDVDDLDTAALRADQSDLLEQLVTMRRRISRMRRLLSLHRDMYTEIGSPDFFPEREPREAEALEAMTHRLERATEAVANAREMLIGTFDVHMTRTAQRTNDIMRLLTWVSVTLLPAGVLAGIMGMNFQVSFFDNPTVFWIVVGTMVVVAVATLSIARWRRLL
jgi:Mg2+ and Co2+ transporter CorA